MYRFSSPARRRGLPMALKEIVDRNNPPNAEYKKAYSDYLMKIYTYKWAILKLTGDYLNNPNQRISNDMDSGLYQFMKTCIRHFEKKEKIETPYKKEMNDDNFLFDPFSDVATPSVSLHNCFKPLPIEKTRNKNVYIM